MRIAQLRDRLAFSARTPCRENSPELDSQGSMVSILGMCVPQLAKKGIEDEVVGVPAELA